jgi:cupin fold WbuC family metalloprotein
MINFYNESEEVLYSVNDTVFLKAEDLDELKRKALLTPRQRVRLCAHQSTEDRQHEMFIVHTRDCYVRPHKHIGKAESMTILEGEVDVVFFNEDGTILKTILMGPQNSGKIFYQRLSDAIYHTLIIQTDFLVFHEITEGPFLRGDTAFPDWAPSEQGVSSAQFIEKIKLQIKNKWSNNEV